MSTSLISSLMNLLDRQSIASIASRVGESEESVSRGLGPTFAAILGGMANKTNDLGVMRQIFDLIGGAPADSFSLASLGNLATGGTTTSPLVEMGQRLIPTVFGVTQNTIAEGIEQSSGLSSGVGTRLMGLAAPLVLGIIGKRVREDGLGLSGFTKLLQGEASEIKNYLPSSLSSLWGSVTTGAPTVRAYDRPVAPVIDEPKRSTGWLWPAVAAVAACLGILWLIQRNPVDTQRAADAVTTGAAETATRARATVAGLGDFIARQLPGSINLNIPSNGMEAHLLSFIEDAGRAVDANTWFDFDRLNFDTGSATLRPESSEQLRNIASIMKAYPNVRMKIGGYTDNTGDPAANKKLSQNRADSVMQDLVGLGVEPNRLGAEGYGQQYPIADNSTEEGRAKNRRISMRVTQK